MRRAVHCISAFLVTQKMRIANQHIQWLMTNHTECIIDRNTFAAAQSVLLKLRETNKDRPRPQKSEFTGKIYCPLCGKAYKRNTSNGSVGWNCSTYLSQGKAVCHGKKISETTLKTVCAEVLGIGEYNSTVFDTLIERIEVPEDNHLRFI